MFCTFVALFGSLVLERNPSKIINSIVTYDECQNFARDYSFHNYTSSIEENGGICRIKESKNIKKISYIYLMENNTENANKCKAQFYCENCDFKNLVTTYKSYCLIPKAEESPPHSPPSPYSPQVVEDLNGLTCENNGYIFSDNLLSLKKTFSTTSAKEKIAPINNVLKLKSTSYSHYFYNNTIFEPDYSLVTSRVNSVVLNNLYSNKCCYICNNLFESCGGFRFYVNTNTYECHFLFSNENFKTLNFTFDDNVQDEESFSFYKSFDTQTTISPPPPPSINIFLLILQTPELFIPSVIGIILVLLLFVFLFRECNTERANALASVINTILRRNKTEIIIK